MTERVRDYKKRIDAEWRKNEMDRDRLIEKIKEYELFDDLYKKKVEKEIMDNFSKKEKEGRGKDYNDIVKLIEDADKKYEILNQLKRTLEMKEEEKIQNEKKIRENKLGGVDKTAMERQSVGRKKLIEKGETLQREIEEIKKEISDKEEEIEDIEEEYGKKSDIDEVSESESMEDREVTYRKTEIKEPTTLEEFHDQTIKDLWEKDRIRGEIIKILEKGSWIGDELSKDIKEKLFETFFAYYDEKQGSLRMKAGRREKNKQNRSTIKVRGKAIKHVPEKLGMEEEVVNTPRQVRESLILQWYEKKLNRDELLRVLDENEMMDKESKKKLEEEIMEEFYENYEKAKEEGGYQSADIKYRDKERVLRQWREKMVELRSKREGTKGEMKMIDEEMEAIAQNAMKLEKGSWWRDKRKLEKAKTRRDELDKQERKIKEDLGKIVREESELRLLFNEKKEIYGPIIERSVRRPEKIERKMSKVQEKSELEEQTTLKGYKERYEQMIKDREAYSEKLLGIVRDLDIGISDEKKKEVLEDIELNMKKEVEKLKEGNEFTKMADEIEKWLGDNWKITMEKLIGKKKEIEEKDNQIKELDDREKSADIEEIVRIRNDASGLKGKKFELEEEYEQVKSDLEEKLRKYDGSYILEEEFVVETYEERKWKILKKELMRQSPYKGIGIEKVKKEETLKGYKEKYDQMIKDKEEYMKNFLERLGDMDLFGITEEKKEDVMLRMEKDMKKEIDVLKKGDESTRMAKEIDKGLKENRRSIMERLVGMKKEIEEKEKQLKEFEHSEDGKDTDEEVQGGDEEHGFREELSKLKEEYEQAKSDFEEKLKKYDGSYISEEEFVVETYEERKWRTLKEKLMSQYPYKGIGIEEVKKEETLKGYKEKYDQMIKDKEEYMKNFLGKLVDTDLFGITEGKKEDVMLRMEKDMKKEIEALKKGDESTRMAEEIDKWLEENWKTMVGKLVDLQLKIEASNDEKEKKHLKNSHVAIKNELIEKIHKYEGNDMVLGRKFIDIKRLQLEHYGQIMKEILFDRYGKLSELAVIGEFGKMGGKYVFKILNRNGKCYVRRGDYVCGSALAEIYEIKEMRGQPLFKGKDSDGNYRVIRGSHQCGSDFTEIYEIKEVGGYPLFKAKDSHGKYHVVRGGDEIGSAFTEIYEIKEVGGYPLFKAKDSDGNYRVMRRCYQCGSAFTKIYDIKEMRGRPLFKAKDRDGNYHVMRGCDECGYAYTKIYEIKEMGGYPLFKVKDGDGKYQVIRHERSCGGRYDEIYEIKEAGGYPLFKVKDSDGNYRMMRGRDQCGGRYKEIYEVGVFEGKPAFKYMDPSGNVGIRFSHG